MRTWWCSPAQLRDAEDELPCIPPPDGLSEETLAVWQREAPYALVARTLTPASAGSFRDLCEVTVARDAMRDQIRREGYTLDEPVFDKQGNQVGTRTIKHPLLAEYRGLEVRVEAARARFSLAPTGRPMMEDDEHRHQSKSPTSPLDVLQRAAAGSRAPART
jgi:hypothetical protein